jgi:ParB/RepB/Spo0J family partition protein
VSGRIERFPVAALKPDPAQPRKAFPEDDLRRLGASLRKKQLHPLLVTPANIIVDGERRWRAARLAGLDALDAVVVPEGTSPAEALEIQLVAALHRAHLTAFEQASGYRDWLAHNPAATAKDLAARIDRDPSLVTKYLAVFDCVPAVQEAAAAEKIGPSQWYPIAQLPTAEQPEVLAMHLVAQLSRALAQLSRARKAAGRTIAPAVKRPRVAVPLPGGVRVVLSGADLALSDVITALAAALEAARRASRDGLDVRTAEKVWADKAKAAP